MKITEGTLIPISLVIILIGGVVWLTTLYFTTQSNAAAIDKIQLKYDAISDKLDDIVIKIDRIEHLLNKGK